jgi:hypothetical protein
VLASLARSLASPAPRYDSPTKTGAPKDPISPAHTRIFNNGRSPDGPTHLYEPSAPGHIGSSSGGDTDRRKFNCCRQVMDILEKQDYKLKRTFNHTSASPDSIKVRSNHTFPELTAVLQSFGAKVDEGQVREAFGVRPEQREVT